MRRLIKITCLVILIFSTSIAGMAQRSNRVHSKWVPDNGYWVIESNIHTPETNIFYFYNNNDSLIYKERIEGMRIDIKKKSTLKKLKKILDDSLLAWDKINKAKADGSLVETVLKTKKD